MGEANGRHVTLQAEVMETAGDEVVKAGLRQPLALLTVGEGPGEGLVRRVPFQETMFIENFHVPGPGWVPEAQPR